MLRNTTENLKSSLAISTMKIDKTVYEKYKKTTDLQSHETV